MKEYVPVQWCIRCSLGLLDPRQVPQFLIERLQHNPGDLSKLPVKQKLGLVTDKIKLDTLNNLALKCYHQDDNVTQADF